MRILVLGGSGSLGSDLVPILSAKHTVLAPGHAEVDLLRSDSLRAAIDKARADAVVNAAAMADVDRCEREPARAWDLNSDAVRWLAQVCRERNATLVQISTDYVFDGKKGAPYVESDRTRPVQVYGKSKLQGEKNALDVAGKAVVVRTSWLFARKGKNFPNKVLAAARTGGEIKAVSDWFGSPTSTVDLSRAIGTLLEGAATGIFHVVNEGVQSRLEQANEILAAVGAGNKATVSAISSATLLDLPAARPRFTALASERAAAAGVHMRPRAEAVREFVS
ncbi:MAG TPA: dTDP-4-dehydrorhamnose reductase [bacterium]|nr:dTDP-4-dehydrorhamnose reductase [bacterium]